MTFDIFDPSWRERLTAKRSRQKPEPKRKSLGNAQVMLPPKHHFEYNDEERWVCSRCGYRLGSAAKERKAMPDCPKIMLDS